MSIREKLIVAIDAEVGAHQCLSAAAIADRILQDVPEVKNSYDQGAVYAFARMAEVTHQYSLAYKLIVQGRIDTTKAFEYDVAVIRDGSESPLPSGME